MGKALLYGIHDPGGEHLLPAGSWIVFTEGIGADPDDLSGGDYRRWSEQGYNVIVRLNYGYGADGTIPAAEKWDDFAKRVGNFVRNSPGCTRWIIGNEPNHSQERPSGEPIAAEEYAVCFGRVANSIIMRAGTQHDVIAAAVAPWNVETGDWLLYMQRMLEGVAGWADGIALHTYTHGSDPALIASEATMQPSYERRRFHFRAYRDLLSVVPASLRRMPVYITETDQDVPWADANSGWVQAAYAEIDAWNRTAGTQKVQCLCLYRWPNYDQWGFADNVGVHDDLRAAVARNYTSPRPSPEEREEGNIDQLPPAEKGHTPSLVWDKRLTQRGVSLVEASVPAGTPVYRLVRGEYLTPEESGGNPLIWVDVLDERGVRIVGAQVVQSWEDGSARQSIEAKPGEAAGTGFLMTSAGNAYRIAVGDDLPSDEVKGMGLGTVEEPHVNHHVGYRLVFQRVAGGAVPVPEGTTVHLPVVPGPVDGPAPVVVLPVDLFPQVMEFVWRWEGGFVDNPVDPGGATNMGITIGTLSRWREAKGLPKATVADVRNLTKTEAEQIYREWYWTPSGAAKATDYPTALLLMDSGVLHGVGAAQAWVQEYGLNPFAIAARRLSVYTGKNEEQWRAFGRAWTRRTEELLREMATGYRL